MAINKAKILTVTSMKGGVGKSTFTLQLAATFEKMKKKVLIIDLDLYGGVIAPMLNISNDNDICKLIDDLNNNRFQSFDDYISKYNDAIDVLPAPKDPRTSNKVSMRYLNIVLTKASIKYDIVLVDTNHILNETNLVVFDISDEIIYLVSDDLMDFKNMRTMVSILKDMDSNKYLIVLNEAFRKKGSRYNKYDAKNLIKTNIDYILSSDLYVRNIEKYVVNGKIPLIGRKMINKLNMICKNLLSDKK